MPSLNNYAIFLRNVRQNYTGTVELNSTHAGTVEPNSTHTVTVELNATHAGSVDLNSIKTNTDTVELNFTQTSRKQTYDIFLRNGPGLKTRPNP